MRSWLFAMRWTLLAISTTALVATALVATAQAANPPAARSAHTAARATGTATATAPASVSAPASGQTVYEHWCAPCHAAGPGHPGTQSLQLKYAGKIAPVLIDRTDLSPQTVTLFVRQGVLLMAPFRKTEITDAELDALAAYVTKNLKKP